MRGRYWEGWVMKTITFMNVKISRAMVGKALTEFDQMYPDTNDYDCWLEKRNYKYEVFEEGKSYPPKYILSMVSRIPTSEFNGGEQTNSVFRDLGFQINDKLVH
jgi:hypothetical protein